MESLGASRRLFAAMEAAAKCTSTRRHAKVLHGLYNHTVHDVSTVAESMRNGTENGRRKTRRKVQHDSHV